MATDRAPFNSYRGEHEALLARLEEHGIRATVIATDEDLDFDRLVERPQLALIDLSFAADDNIRRWLRICRQTKLSTIALVPQEQVTSLDVSLDVDDFVVSPTNFDEVVSRARRALWREEESGGAVIRVGDLVVDPERYQVSLAGRRIDLTFKEYELLRLLASNPGRVYTRAVLLDQIWGYHYFGGTRTVDVHIRRLRSKIEDTGQSFIETVWKAGYRFRDVGRTL